jgi:hypothetical protein
MLYKTDRSKYFLYVGPNILKFIFQFKQIFGFRITSIKNLKIVFFGNYLNPSQSEKASSTIGFRGGMFNYND